MAGFSDSEFKKRAAWDTADRTDTGSRDSVPGLVFRPSTKGAEGTFVLRFRSRTELDGKGNGKQKRITIGRWPAMSVADARRKAREMRDAALSGDDPIPAVVAHDDDDSSNAGGGLRCLRDVIAAFLENGMHDHSAAYRTEMRRILGRMTAKVESGDDQQQRAIKALGDTKIEAVTARKLAPMWETLRGAGKATAAFNTFRYLSAFFAGAKAHGLVKVNPLDGLKPFKKWKPVRRQRFLDMPEVGKVWNALAAGANLDVDTSIMLRLQMLTGLRSDAILGATMGEIDLDAKVWRVSWQRLKGWSADDGDYRLPLCDAAVSLLRTALKRNAEKRGDSGLVWPAAPRKTVERIATGRVADAVASDHQRLSRAVARNYESWGVKERFTPHDFRRTLATNLGLVGISLEAREALLQHKAPGASAGNRDIVSVYNVGDLFDARKDALERWEGMVLEAAERARGANVIAMAGEIA